MQEPKSLKEWQQKALDDYIRDVFRSMAIRYDRDMLRAGIKYALRDMGMDLAGPKE